MNNTIKTVAVSSLVTVGVIGSSILFLGENQTDASVNITKITPTVVITDPNDIDDVLFDVESPKVEQKRIGDLKQKIEAKRAQITKLNAEISDLQDTIDAIVSSVQ